MGPGEDARRCLKGFVERVDLGGSRRAWKWGLQEPAGAAGPELTSGNGQGDKCLEHPWTLSSGWGCTGSVQCPDKARDYRRGTSASRTLKKGSGQGKGAEIWGKTGADRKKQPSLGTQSLGTILRAAGMLLVLKGKVKAAGVPRPAQGWPVRLGAEAIHPTTRNPGEIFPTPGVVRVLAAPREEQSSPPLCVSPAPRYPSKPCPGSCNLVWTAHAVLPCSSATLPVPPQGCFFIPPPPLCFPW